jgi:uncharacterized protein (DUF1800 family)
MRSAVPSKPDDRTIVHVLNRLGFGPAPGDIERVRSLGLQTYIEQQLHPERLEDTGMSARLSALDTLGKSTREMAAEYFVPAQMARRQRQQQAAQDPAMSASSASTPPSTSDAPRRETMTSAQIDAVRMERQALTELMQAKVLRAAYSQRQLEELMVDFWFNHFNVFVGKGPVRLYLNEYERDAIRPHVLGKFRHLLQATAESPAMLFYLDNWQSSAPVDARMSQAARPNRAGQMRRARTDGTSHARRRRRLHAEGCSRGRPSLHRLDDRQPSSGRRIPVRAAYARRRREGGAGAENQGWR